MSEYTYKLSVGRRGVVMTINMINESAEAVKWWASTFNGKGFTLSRHKIESGKPIDLVKEDTFLYPDRISDEDIDFLSATVGSLLDEEPDIVRLLSLLSAMWSAGHDEESMHTMVRNTLRRWSK
ncbi:hypothetical protein A73_49 [Escherichia phage A73]|uniref:Uncharacterized protein n=1 Tax=Escherichia phage A73 TaxID=3003819 RepID=A0AAE9W547_9CAUD|nr:hypothetical protein A73_49 [Escherichia phage A73]